MQSNPAFTHLPQFRQGKNVEAFLDEFFRAKGWQITQTTSEQERVQCLGDRIYRRGELQAYVEYKSGIQSFYTGNIFLETVSIDTTGKPGWVYTCKADYIFYAAVLNGFVIIFRPELLRARIAALKLQFREVATSQGQNTGYNTHGLIIPLDYARHHIADKVVTL